MAVMQILKALGPLIVQAGGVAAGLRTSGATAKADQRVAKLEQEVLGAGGILKAVAEQLHALAQELSRQAEITGRLQRRARTMFVLSLVALLASLGAVAMAAWR
jgi:hypothetical protein